MDRPMDGWINERTSEWTMFFSYTDAMDASENDDFPTDFAIFTKALGTNGPTDQWTDIHFFFLISNCFISTLRLKSSIS